MNISSVTDSHGLKVLLKYCRHFCTKMSFFTKTGNVHIKAWKSNKYYMFWVYICSLSYPACAILSSVASPTQQYFSLSHNSAIFLGWGGGQFSLELSEIWTKIYIGLHVKYLLFLWGFIKTLIFIEWFSKNGHISNFMKVRPVGAELFHADKWT